MKTPAPSCAVILLVCLIGGCGKSSHGIGTPDEQLEMIPGERPRGNFLLVHVMIDGKDLDSGQIVLQNIESGEEKVGEIREKGMVLLDELSTGKYLVAVRDGPLKIDPQMERPREPLPLNYASPLSSGLELELGPGENQRVLRLTRNP